MITIYAERCTGCGACLDACPSGALCLVEGKAMVDEALCHGCEACLAACPTRAIALAGGERGTAGEAHLPSRRPDPEVIHIAATPASAPVPFRALSAAGAALVWAGRKILPRLAELVLDRLALQVTRPTARGETRGIVTPSGPAQGGGWRHRHRRRGV